MTFSPAEEAADRRETRRLAREVIGTDPLKAEVLRALRPSPLRCGLCEKRVDAVLNVANVAWVCVKCYGIIAAAHEDGIEQARRTR